MKTIDVKFQGKDYKIRRNMYTMHLFQTELQKAGEVGEVGNILIFAYCALKGYNEYNGTLEDVMMYLDDEENISLVEGIAELFKSEDSEEKDTEKK